jgi:riboflavin kinase
MSGNTKFETLLLLLKKGAHEREIEVSLSELAKDFKTSKQTAARRLKELEAEGFIFRRHTPSGQAVKLISAGVTELKKVYLELEKIFKKKRAPLRFAGRVTTGLGEGRYYMRQPQYAERFKKELGYAPYPGTLDIELDPDSREIRDLLLKLPAREIPGFKTQERAFGSVKLFLGKLMGTEGAVILPLRGHRRDILEFIAMRNLRRALKLKDGSRVEVEVEL